MSVQWFSMLFLLTLSVAHADPCPDGFTQSPNGGDCYKIKWFFDTFIGQYYPPQSFDEMDYYCTNGQGTKATGGMLASIHSQEENENIRTLMDSSYGNHGERYCDAGTTNIGLRCTGKDCRWDDGSPVTYTNFETDPYDDAVTRCYGVRYGLKWTPKQCGTYQSDCWLCSVKAKTIECNHDELAYKGGCVSVHTTPMDHKSAEASCQAEGGHLISVHGNYEGGVYAHFAVLGGARGTVHIGGEFVNGKFEWIDGSYPAYDGWANGFPNTIFGSCVQMLLAREFGDEGRYTNIDCTIKQAYLCFRNGAEYGPTAFPPPPKADAKCPSIQYYSGTGTIYSPNYPLSIPSKQSCEYVIGTKEGTLASINFTTFNCQGTTLSLYDGLNSIQPFFTFTNYPPVVNSSYTAKSNVMRVVFAATGNSAPVGTGWEAEFKGV